MIATMSSRGQVVIPQAVRECCQFGEGDHFLVEADPGQQVVTLRKVKAGDNWFAVYMACPHSFDMPPRRKQYNRRKHELAD